MRYVYIEDATLTSFAIDFILISLTLNMTGQKTLMRQKCIGTIFAVSCSIILSVLNIHHTFLILIKILLGLGVSIICTEKITFREVTLFYLVFISFTFLMGGAVYAMQSIFNISPSALLVLCIIAPISILIRSAIRRFYFSRSVNQFSYYIEVKHASHHLTIKAYLDSGNLAVDDTSLLPIIILDYNTFINLFDVTLIDCLSHSLHRKLEGKYISVASINSASEMFITLPDELYIIKNGHKIKINALIGLSKSSHFVDNHHALLSPLLL